MTRPDEIDAELQELDQQWISKEIGDAEYHRRVNSLLDEQAARAWPQQLELAL